MKGTSGWFTVDPGGLAEISGRRSKRARLRSIVYELLQNSWDERSTLVRVAIARARDGVTRIVVEDDNPGGFERITDAWTLFAPSLKRSDAEKRGRFNVGEKFAISLAKEASIATTKGTVRFTRAAGERVRIVDAPAKTEAGTAVTLTLAEKLTAPDLHNLLEDVMRVIPPVQTLVNGVAIGPRKIAGWFRAALDTEIDHKRTRRVSDVWIYRPADERGGWIYELGVPVVRTGDAFDVDVRQRVPLAIERDNVRPSYLRDLRAHVLNATAKTLSEDEAAEGWVSRALESPLTRPDTVARTVKLRYGDRAVVYDPSDREANSRAVAEGYTVIPARAFSAAAWASVRRAEVVEPAGRVTPSPTPFTADGRSLVLIDAGEDGAELTRLALWLADVSGIELDGVDFAREPDWPFAGVWTMATRRITLNLARLENDSGLRMGEAVSTLIHELAHAHAHDHFSEAFHAELSRIAALAVLAAREGR